MFGNQSEFEQCQNITPVELDCCCEYKFPQGSLLSSVPVGMLAALSYSVGLIAISAQKKSNTEKKTLRQKIEDVKLNYTWLYYLLMVIFPKTIEKIAYVCLKDYDERLVGCSYILFSFVFTIICAFYICFDGNRSDGKVALYLCAFASFGGAFTILKHMPYEDNYAFNEFIDRIKQPRVIIYLAANSVIALIAYKCNWELVKLHEKRTHSNGGEGLENQRITENTNEEGMLEHDSDDHIVALSSHSDGESSAATNTYFNNWFWQEKMPSLLQVVFLSCANTLIGVGFTTCIHIVDHWFSEKIEFVQFIPIFLILLLTAGAFFSLKLLLDFKDPVFMAVMTCNIEVFNRAVYAFFVYHQNLSCSFLEGLLYYEGFVTIALSLIGFLFISDNFATS